MKKVLIFVVLAVVAAAIVGGILAWKEQVWVFAPKEAEVTEELPTVEEAPESEIEIPVEAPAEDL